MKKSLLVLGCLASFGGVTQAESVQVYGRLDSSLTSTSGVGSDNETLTGLAYGALSSSRWGIKGNEDLGGGYKFSFALESEVHNDTGYAGGNNKTGSNAGDVFWKRKSVLAMKTPFGKFSFGLNKTIDKILASKYDLVGSNFGGFKTMTDYIAVGDRIDNSIFYESPQIFTGGKVYFERMFGEIPGEQESNTRTGFATTFEFASTKTFIAYSEAKGSLGASDWSQFGIGLQYKTPLKIVLKAQYWNLSNDTASDISGLGYSADGEGFSISAMGAVSKQTKIGFGYHSSKQSQNEAEKIEIMQLVLLHSLSKTITGYMMAADLKNGVSANHEIHKKGFSSQAGNGVNQNGVTIGLRIKF